MIKNNYECGADRDAYFANENGKDLFYASKSTRAIAVWEVNDIDTPFLKKYITFDNSIVETYGVRVNP